MSGQFKIERHSTYEKNERKCHGDSPCVYCGKPIKDPKFMVHLFWGSIAVTEDEAARIIANEGEGGDLLFYPIGSDCLKKHPEILPFVTRS